MKHVVYKPYFNWENEEKWLNKMSAKGLAMKSYTWCRYVFEETPPGEYIYRIDFLDHMPSSQKGKEYIRFLEETGAEFVDFYFRWVYFRKKADRGPFFLYSDISSQITHKKRVRAFWLIFAFLECAIGASNMVMGTFNSSARLNLIVGSFAFAMGIFFGLWSLQLTMKIQALRKEQIIREG